MVHKRQKIGPQFGGCSMQNLFFYPQKCWNPQTPLGCISKTWSLSTVCENMRRKRPLTAEKSFSPKKSIFNGSKLRSCFSPFVDQSSPDHSARGRDRSLQRRFQIVDILFHSGDIIILAIELRSRPKSGRKKHVFRPPFFGGRTPNFWT